MAWDQQQRVKALVFVRRKQTQLSQAEAFISGLATVEDSVLTGKARLAASVAVLTAAIADPDATPGEVTQMTTLKNDFDLALALLNTLPPP